MKTNFEWIMELNEVDFARYILNPCDNFSCEDCPLKDKEQDRCMLNSAYAQGDGRALAWLRREHTWEPPIEI